MFCREHSNWEGYIVICSKIKNIDLRTKRRKRDFTCWPLSRTMEALQTAEDGGEQQKGLLQKTGEILADIVGTNLSTADTETEIEFNFAVVKITHKVIRSK